MKSWDVCLFLGMFLVARGVRGVGRCPPQQCVLLERCPLLSARLRSRALRNSVRDAVCGYSGLRAKVCCPINDLADVEMMHPNDGSRMQETAPELGTTMHKVSSTTEKISPELERLLPLQCGRPRVSSRIFGGNLTDMGVYPWMVAMRYSHASEGEGHERVLCAGSLISSRYVVTAAHCLDYSKTKGWNLSSVALGDWRLSTDPDCAHQVCSAKAVVMKVGRSIISEVYNSTTLENDIALLRLDQPVNFSWSVQPICLPPRTFTPGEVSIGSLVRAAGWGMTEAFQNSDVLLEATLPIANPVICKAKFPFNFHLNGKQMCAGGGKSDTCLGDSGGPVMKLNSDKKLYLLAVTSFGSLNCGTVGHPAVYTSVAHFSDWIRTNIKP